MVQSLIVLLGLSLSVSIAAAKCSFGLVKESIASYRHLYGHVNVPYSFVVPNHTDSEPIWPAESRGLKLGHILSRIRTRGDYMKDVEQKQQLLDLGVEVKKKRDSDFETIIEALKIYSGLSNSMNIDNSFVCPDDAPWPSHLHGYRLGSRIHSIRYQGAYADEEKQKRLRNVGLKPLKRMRRRLHGETLLQALESYKGKFGDLHIPVKYVVPKDDRDFPEDVRGLPLGITVAKIRTRGDFKEYRDQLDAIGFQWIVWRDKEFRSILSQLAFQELEALDGLSLLEGLWDEPSNDKAGPSC